MGAETCGSQSCALFSADLSMGLGPWLYLRDLSKQLCSPILLFSRPNALSFLSPFFFFLVTFSSFF